MPIQLVVSGVALVFLIALFLTRLILVVAHHPQP